MARTVRRIRRYSVLDSGYRSKLEERIAAQLEGAGIPFSYETLKVPYVVPERKATYTPDFMLPNGIIIEGKGVFEETADRQKMLLVKEQNPDLDIRFLFDTATRPIYKGSKTTYSKWAETHGFPWAEKRIPEEWLTEAKAKSRSRTRSH